MAVRTAGVVRLEVVPDLTGFQKSLKSQLSGKPATTKIKAEADTEQAVSDVRKAADGTDATATVETKADTSGLKGAVSKAADAAKSSTTVEGRFVDTGIRGAINKVVSSMKPKVDVVGSYRDGGLVSGIRTSMASAASAASEAGQQIRQAFSGASQQVGSDVDGGARSATGSLGRIPAVAKAAAGAVAGIAGAGAILKGGFDRLMGIQRSEIIFKNIGLSADETSAQMDKLSEQVTGTSVSLADAAQKSSAFAQAGVELGKPMDDAIDAFASLSAAAGDSGVDVGFVMQQISAQGKVTGNDMMQLSGAGINAAAWLADSMGISMSEVSDKVSAGEVSFDDFVKAVNSGAGDLAHEMGQTLPAKIGNMKTAFSNLGAAVIEPVIAPMTAAVEVLTNSLKAAVPHIKSFFEWFSGGSTGAEITRDALMGIAAAATAFFVPAMVSSATAAVGSAATITGAFISTAADAWKPIGTTVKALATMAAEWIKTGIASTVGAGQIALSWIKAAPRRATDALKSLGTMALEWGRAGVAAMVNGTKVATAWVLSAPKRGAQAIAALPQLILGWGKAGLAATINAVKVAAAWVIAAPKNMWIGVTALGQMALAWARAGIAATVNAVKMAASWLIALGPVGLIIGAVAGIIALFVTLWNKCDGFREFWVNLWESIKNVVSAAWQWITGVFSSIDFGEIWSGIVTGAQAAWDVIVSVWNGAVDFFGGVFSGIWQVVQTAWEGISTAFLWVWETVLSPIYNWFVETWGSIAEKIGPVWDAVSTKIGEFGGWLSEFWNSTLYPIVSKIIGFFQQIGQAIGTFIAEHWSVLKPILIVLGTVILLPIIAGLAAVVAAIVAVVAIVGIVIGAITGFIYVLTSLPGWIAGAVNAIKNWFGQAWQWTKDKFSAMGDAVSSFWSDHVATLPGKIGNAVGEIIDWFKGLPGKIKGAVSDAGSWLKDTGKHIIDGLKKGLENKVKDIGEWFLDKLPGFIRKPFEKVMGIASPSKVFAQYGVFIGQGLINGVDSMGSQVASATQAMADQASDITPPVITPQIADAARTALQMPPTQTPDTGDGATAPSVGAGEGAGPQAEGDPAAALATAATSMQATTTSILDPLWTAQNLAVTGFGTNMATTMATQVTPQFSMMASALAGTKATVMDPMFTGINGQLANTSNAFNGAVNGQITPAWQRMGADVLAVKTGTVDPMFAGIQGGLNNTVAAFANAATGIANQWNRVKEATAAPVRFTINSVFNDGLVGMWNSVAEMLGVDRMPTYQARFATGGYVRGPGGPTDDKIPALLSDREFVINAKATRALGPENLAALNSGNYSVAPGVLRDPAQRRAMLQDKTFRGVASRYQGGGIAQGTPAWKALLRGYNWARSRDGRPYVWGGSADGAGGADCCLDAGTMVYGPDGAKRIDEIAAGDLVYSFVDGTRSVETVTHAWFSKTQDTYRVRTRNRAVIASDNHPFMRLVEVDHGSGCTPSTWDIEWARTDELREGDLLVTPKSLDSGDRFENTLPSGRVVSEDQAWLLGLILGDGSVGDKNVRVCVYDEVRDHAATTLLSMGASSTTYTDDDGVRGYSSALARELVEAGFRGRSYSKRIPECVWGWDDTHRRAFLDGYCDADGHYPAEPAKHGERTYASSSRALAEDARALHITLGDAVSNISTNDRSGTDIVIKGVAVQNARPLHMFTVWEGKRGAGTVAICRNSGVRQWVESGDFTVTKLLSVEDHGVRDTYDLEIEGAHNFIADGIVVHNSGFMSGIADVILGGSGARQWTTYSFPGSQGGAWAPGLASGFSVGISAEHTAGTIGGVEGIPPVNVESGGSNGGMAFGRSTTVGANDGQFPNKQHLVYTGDGKFIGGSGSGADMGQIISGMVKPFQDKMNAAISGWSASHPGLINTWPAAIADKLGGAAKAKIDKLVEEMMAHESGNPDSYRGMIKAAYRRQGYQWTQAKEDAWVRQIASESSGIPGRVQEIVDQNGTGESAGVGLGQMIPTTWAAYRDPELPDDRKDPWAMINAMVRYGEQKFGDGLLDMIGHGHGYDRGGIAPGIGAMLKWTNKPERVLSPRQTTSFDRLVSVLDRGGAPGDAGGRTEYVGQRVENQYLTNPDDVLRATRRGVRKAARQEGLRV